MSSLAATSAADMSHDCTDEKPKEQAKEQPKQQQQQQAPKEAQQQKPAQQPAVSCPYPLLTGTPVSGLAEYFQTPHALQLCFLCMLVSSRLTCRLLHRQLPQCSAMASILRLGNSVAYAHCKQGCGVCHSNPLAVTQSCIQRTFCGE